MAFLTGKERMHISKCQPELFQLKGFRPNKNAIDLMKAEVLDNLLLSVMQ